MMYPTELTLTNGQELFLNGDWKSKLEPNILELYNEIKEHPTLSQQECYLAIERDRGYEHDSIVVSTGSLDECFQKAFDLLFDYHIIYVQLPIGETIYNVAEFVYRGEEIGYAQETFLSKRIIKHAIPTIDGLIEHEIELVENNNYTKDDIFNTMMMLSEPSYLERFCSNNAKRSLFEDILAEINMAGSVIDAMQDNYGDTIDISTPYKQARFKAFTRMLLWEHEEKVSTKKTRG